MWDEKFVYQLSDKIQSGLLVATPDLRVVLWNKAAELITAIPPRDVIDRPFNALPEILRSLLDTPHEELCIMKHGGVKRLIQKQLSTMVVDGTCRYTVVSFIDVTPWVSRRDNLEDLLADSQKHRGLGVNQARVHSVSVEDPPKTQERVEEQNRIMLHQMEIAARLQKSLLPDVHQHFNGVIVSSKFVPSKHIGGDLYDVIDLGHGLTGVLIADVSGHGVASALISSMFKMIFHSLAETVASPKILFHLINQELTRILREDFISAFYVLADCRAKTITFTNAAHPSPLLFRKKTSEIVELDTDGLFLGMFEDGLYEEQFIPGIEEGDVLLLYTDCILEELNEQGTPYGKSRLKDAFSRIVQRSTGQDIIELLEDDVHNFCGRESLEDDFTMLVLEFKNQCHMAFPDDDNDPADTRNEHCGDGFMSF